MADFISTPPPKKQRIPIPTVDDLVTALVQYLPTAFDFQYLRRDLWPEREFGFNTTKLRFYDKRRSDTKPAIEIEIEGKFAQSGNARLWADPFLVIGWVIPFSEPLKLPITDRTAYKNIIAQRAFFGIRIIPQADSSIAFQAVRRWDRGNPIFDD